MALPDLVQIPNLEAFTDLSDLHQLSLKQVTDLSPLADLNLMRRLYLRGVPVTDDGPLS